MAIRVRSNATPWAALFFALLGLVWCGYIAFPTGNPAPCATSGCALFRDSRIAGVSLWWVGGAYFFLLLIACLRGNRMMARFMAAVALFLDSLLLVVMFLTAPCFDCLVVAVFFGLTYYCLRSGGEDWFVARQAPSLLLPIWFGLFLGNAVLAANEQIPMFTMGNSRSNDVRIYFSPSCNACRAAILASGNAAALYPIEENAGDTDSIIRLNAFLKANVPMREALSRSIDENEPVPHLPFHERMILSLQLVRNKAMVLRQGFRALPVIEMNGMPVAGTTPAERKRELLPPRFPETRSEQPREEPVYTLDPSYGEPSSTEGTAQERSSRTGGDAGDQHDPAQPGVNGEQSNRGRNTSAPPPPGCDIRYGASGQTDLGSLPDFLQNAEDLARCSRKLGQPCD